MEAKLTDLGLNSFDIVRIANQIEVELGVGAPHGSHMTMLVEKLLDCELNAVVEYIVDSLVTCEGHVTLTGKERRGLCRSRGDDEFQGGDTKWLKVGRDITTNHVTDATDHVPASRGHTATVTVNWWRRGQCFVNR
jgi:hypothetical protein